MPPISRDMRGLIDARLSNQHLTAPTRPQTATDVVSWLGAVQAQEYPHARWALGLRASALSDAAVERAFDTGQILRTHVLRPTWHFVSPSDIRWLLALTGPRVKVAMSYYDRQLDLDSKVFAKSQTVIARALASEPFLSRAEIGERLRAAGIDATGQRLGHVMMQAELDALVCSGPRRGAQFTYALLDDRAPRTKTLVREQAVAELVRRYFTSHGPATLRDFSWWSGLTVADGRSGLSALGAAMEWLDVEGRTFWFAAGNLRPQKTVRRAAAPIVHLLPIYDECLNAYKDRDPVITALTSAETAGPPPGLQNQVLLDGLLAGWWGRTVSTEAVDVKVILFQRPTKATARALTAAGNQYASFMQRRLQLSVSAP